MEQEKIGAFLREVRKESGLTQEQLAERLGVSQRSVSRWETGRTMPDYALLPLLCEVLEINVAELLNGERIAGDSVSKKQVTATARTMTSIMRDKLLRAWIGAVLSVVLTLVSMLGLYAREYSVSVESTAELERAINEYHFRETISADILERQAMGNRLYVLYGEREYPGAGGLACLEKGIFGKYRLISCADTDSRWIVARTVRVKGTKYCVTCCANSLSGVDAYAVCGSKGEAMSEDAVILFTREYDGLPFMTFTELEDGVTVSPFHTRYYQNGAELTGDALERTLGARHADGAPNSGTTTAELGFLYVLEAILLALGFMFVRYFLSELGLTGKKR